MMQAGEDADLAAAWNEVASQSEKAAEYYQQASGEYRAGMTGYAAYWCYTSAAAGAAKASQYLAKAIENPTQATAWKQAASYSQMGAKHHLGTIKAVSVDNKERNQMAARSATRISHYLAKAIEDPMNAVGLRELAGACKKELGLYTQMISAGDDLSKEDAQSYKDATIAAQKTSQYLGYTISDLENAATWKEAANYSQKRVGYLLNTIEERGKRKVHLPYTSPYSYEQLARLAGEISDCLVKGIGIPSERTMDRLTNKNQIRSAQRSIEIHLLEIETGKQQSSAVGVSA